MAQGLLKAKWCKVNIKTLGAEPQEGWETADQSAFNKKYEYQDVCGETPCPQWGHPWSKSQDHKIVNGNVI